MAKTILTHIGEFSQEFSDPIPLLKELKACSRALLKCTQQALRDAFYATTDEKTARKGPCLIEEAWRTH